MLAIGNAFIYQENDILTQNSIIVMTKIQTYDEKVKNLSREAYENLPKNAVYIKDIARFLAWKN